MSKTKEKPTYEVSNCIVSAYSVPKEQMDAIGKVADALAANASALQELSKSFKPPASVVLETGIKIGA